MASAGRVPGLQGSGFGTEIIKPDLPDGSQFLFRSTGARDVLATLLAALPSPNQPKLTDSEIML